MKDTRRCSAKGRIEFQWCQLVYYRKNGPLEYLYKKPHGDCLGSKFLTAGNVGGYGVKRLGGAEIGGGGGGDRCFESRGSGRKTAESAPCVEFTIRRWEGTNNPSTQGEN